MAKKTLVESSIEAGRDLVLALDNMGVPVKAAFWWLAPESGDWLLVIGTPNVDRLGPRRVYVAIEQALRWLGSSRDLLLEDISVVGDRHPLVMLLRNVLDTGQGIAGIRFRNNVINGELVEDAYIYRLIGQTRTRGSDRPLLKIDSLSLRLDEEGSVKLSVTNVRTPGLGAWTIDVSYDRRLVSVVRCNPEHRGVCNAAFSRDTIRITGASAAGLKGDVILGTIGFKGLKSGISELRLRVEVLADATVGDPQDVSATISHGRVAVSRR